MKSCPTCDRTYADDTFTFCLDDGSLLSAPYDSQSTLQIPAPRNTEPPKTEILPHALTPVNTQPAPPNSTLRDSATLVYTSAATEQTRLTEQRSGKHWLIVGGVVALVALGFVITLGYVAWQINDQSAPQSSKDNSNIPTNSNVSINANRDTEATASDETNSNWLDGVWEGTGYQSNPKSTWTIKLTAQNDTFIIEYPSLSCRGTWTLIEKGTEKARFKETITQGLSRCENNGSVLIEKISDTQISFKYSSPNTRAVTSTAVLSKRGGKTE